jgi:hypothetical protein
MNPTRTAVQTTAPVVKKEFIPGVGETIIKEWPASDPDLIEAEYQLQKSTIGLNSDVASIATTRDRGRAILTVKYNTDAAGINVSSGGIPIVEELYALDEIKDIAAAPYFARVGGTELAAWTTGGNNRAAKNLPLDDDEVVCVRRAVDHAWNEAEITKYATAATWQWASWTIGMKELRYHYLHGIDAYPETGFILRKSSFGVLSSKVHASFVGKNTVVSLTGFSTQMLDLLLSFPTGEWLYKPPQVENLGKGRWRVAQEWHYAERWSIALGGTFNLP